MVMSVRMALLPLIFSLMIHGEFLMLLNSLVQTVSPSRIFVHIRSYLACVNSKNHMKFDFYKSVSSYIHMWFEIYLHLCI